MVNVTDRAKTKLKELLVKERSKTQGEDQPIGLRLGTMAPGQFGVFPDRERADDQIVEHQGAAVLLVGQDVAEQVEHTTIDYEEESEPGPRLVIKRG
jgi:Fe-S cluster assembly iron-binding protein IscA